jgi:REP element-mobilizing transposase RayT
MRFFDELGEIRKTSNKLPHWQQNQCTCFVTFRLRDSIPAACLTHWKADRQNWLRMHPQPWDFETEQEYHRRFSHFIDRQLDDCHGRCLLRDSVCSEIVEESLSHFDGERYLLHCHVVMPNHIHVLFSLDPAERLERVVSTWKRWSSTAIGRHSGEKGGIWQRDYFDRLIRDWAHFINVARYIRNNPHKAGLPEGAYRLYEAPWIEKILGCPRRGGQ